MRYVPDFPERFGSLEDARTFCDGFFLAYNHERRHSGIGMHTRRRCTSAPPSRSRPSGSPHWTVLTPPTLSGSLVALGHRNCPR